MSETMLQKTSAASKVYLEKNSALMLLLRGSVIILLIAIVIPVLNPARISGLYNT